MINIRFNSIRQIKILALLFHFGLLGCFPNARFVMQESLTQYECNIEQVAEVCVNELRKENGI